jgi:P27 family predicted phage terminase small subunit
MSGHALWREVCEELAPRGLRPAHLPLIEMLVTAIVRNREARAKLAEGSAVLVWGDKDNPRFATNPWVKIEKDTAATYLRLAETLGLTPAALARLGLMQVAGQSILVTIAREVAKFAETDEDLDY